MDWKKKLTPHRIIGPCQKRHVEIIHLRLLEPVFRFPRDICAGLMGKLARGKDRGFIVMTYEVCSMLRHDIQSLSYPLITSYSLPTVPSTQMIFQSINLP